MKAIKHIFNLILCIVILVLKSTHKLALYEIAPVSILIKRHNQIFKYKLHTGLTSVSMKFCFPQIIYHQIKQGSRDLLFSY